MLNLLRLIFLILLCIETANVANAEFVSVNRGGGQGFIFNHNNNCYLIIPKHVHGLSRRVTISSVVPSIAGDAEILNLNTSHDLSVGYVSPGFEDKCKFRWDRFSNDLVKILDSSQSAILTRVAASGQLERVEMKIFKFDLDIITAKIVGEEEIYKGTSGGFLTVGDTVIGMATDALDNKTALFLRTDEIQSELSRLIDSRRKSDFSQAVNANNQNIQSCKSAVKIRSIVCNKEAISPINACSNLLKNSPAILPVNDGKLELIVELSDQEASIVRRVDILGERETENSTPVKDVTVLVSTSSKTTNDNRWRLFSSADGSPLGLLALENGSAPYARKIKIEVRSGWNDSKPVQINCLAIN